MAATEHDSRLSDQLRQRNDACILNTYGPRTIALARGEGMTVWDVEGKEYLDFFCGIAVTNLGHNHPAVTEAIQSQAAKLIHTSNLYYIEPQIELAELLCAHSFADKWFFCNSGAEATEAAIKLARRYWSEQGRRKPEIVTVSKSFHGRTLAAVTATAQPKYHAGFEPLLPGIKYVESQNLEALEAAITPDTGAIMLEPVQGEGGVNVASAEYLKRVRELCDEHGMLLVLDEVQCGNGRTGKLYAHEHAGITPDIMTTAKGLGNGVPIGALGCTDEAATGFTVGSHGSTFGGNPLCCAAALATIRTILEPPLLDEVREMGAYLHQRLLDFKDTHPHVKEVRGLGLMQGIEFDAPVAPLVKELLAAGIVCGSAGPNVLRLLPPLIVERDHIDRFMAVLPACVGNVSW